MLVIFETSGARASVASAASAGVGLLLYKALATYSLLILSPLRPLSYLSGKYCQCTNFRVPHKTVLMKATLFPLQFTPPASMYLVLVGDVLLGYLGDLNGVLVDVRSVAEVAY